MTLIFGKAGGVAWIDECKLEVDCPGELVQIVLTAIRQVHPYEESVIHLS